MKKTNLKDAFSFRKNRSGMIFMSVLVVIGFIFLIVGSVAAAADSNDYYDGGGSPSTHTLSVGSFKEVYIGTSSLSSNIDKIEFTPSLSGTYKFDVFAKDTYFTSGDIIYATLTTGSSTLDRQSTRSGYVYISYFLTARQTYTLYLYGTSSGYCTVSVMLDPMM